MRGAENCPRQKENDLHIIRKRRAIAAIAGLISAVTVLSITGASASHPEETLPGSNFEIDTDANLRVDDAGRLDWANVTEIRGIDLPTGATDDSYKGGVKEDTQCPDEVTGSIPNNKSDLLTFHGYREAGTPGFFNFAWSRVSDPSGHHADGLRVQQVVTRRAHRDRTSCEQSVTCWLSTPSTRAGRGPTSPLGCGTARHGDRRST